MKKILILFCAMVFSVSAFAGYWRAEASSPSGWGWGQSYDKYEAKRIALYECAKYTPTWETCYINRVYWVN